MTSISYTYKVGVRKSQVQCIIPIAIANMLHITAGDKICFRVGSDKGNTSHVEARFKLKNNDIPQPSLGSYQVQTDACATIRKSGTSYCVNIPNLIRTHHTFMRGDVFRWTVDIAHDRQISNVRIQYLPRQG